MAYYVTTPIFYVNAAPHLGHAYTTIGADILARHMRQRGEEVFFLTGTDEHGEPVAQAAEREGVTPKELADRNAERFKALIPRINVTNDFFIRTSDPRHKRAVQEFMQTVYDNGYVYKGVYEGWYCPRCADFKTENEVGEDNTCPIHKIPLDREKEENWFFKLSAFQERLEQLYTDQPEFVRPRHRYNEARSFITGGLNDVSLSRSKLTWGVEVPWDPDHVFYVWFDALLNYYTALSFANPDEDLTDKFWPAFHIIGKDILKFHAVFWPAMLMAAGVELPREIYIHGYLLMKDASGEEHKMSKSLGNVLDPFEVMDRFGTDALRYYCFREVSFGQDGGVSTKTFGERYESELANELGNLASRTTNMLGRYTDGKVPTVDVEPELAARLRRPRGGGLRAARRGRDHPGARPHLAARAAPEPVRRGERALAAGQGPRAGRQAQHRPAQPRRGPARAHGAADALHPGVGGEAARRARRARDRHRGRGLRLAPRRAARREARAPLPEAGVIDSHTHLDRGPAPEAELVEQAREAGLTRILTIGMDAESRRAALRAAETYPEVYAAIGHHPNEATGYTPADHRGAARARPAPALPGDRGDRPGRLPRLRAARRPGARLRRPDRARARARASR